MRFAANVGFLFTEHAFLDRFAAAASAGFCSVEFPWPAEDIRDVTSAVMEAGVQVVQMNAPAGDLQAGDRGYTNDPARVLEWREDVGRALSWSQQLGCHAVNLLVGNRLAGVDLRRQQLTVQNNLDWALSQVKGSPTTLLVEVLNDRDTPDYLLTRLDLAAELVLTFHSPALRLQLDSYHVAMMEGSVTDAYLSVAPIVGHVQLADSPGRHEPGTGQADIAAFLKTLIAQQYSGFVSLEYSPAEGTEKGLAWLPKTLRCSEVVRLEALAIPRNSTEDFHRES